MHIIREKIEKIKDSEIQESYSESLKKFEERIKLLGVGSNNLILFLGAGISCNYGIKTWKDLSKSLIRRLNDKELKKFLKKKDLKYKIQIAFDNLNNRGKLVSILKKETLYNKENKKLKELEDSGKHIIQSLSKFKNNNNVKYITTNIDRLFEIYLKERAVIYPKSKNTDKIIKLHGCIDNIDSLIFTPKQYIEMYSELDKEKIEDIFSKSTVLFIGKSLEDEILQMLFKSERLNDIYLLQQYDENENCEIALKCDLKYYKDINVNVLPYTNYAKLPELVEEIFSKVGIYKKVEDISNLRIDHFLEKSELDNSINLLLEELQRIGIEDFKNKYKTLLNNIEKNEFQISKNLWSSSINGFLKIKKVYSGTLDQTWNNQNFIDSNYTFEVLLSLINLTDEINKDKLNKIEIKLNDFFNYQKCDIFFCLLNKDKQSEGYELRILDIIVKTLSNSEEFEKHYIENLLIDNRNFFTKNFKYLILSINKYYKFGEVMARSENLESFQPILTKGESLKNGLIFLLKQIENREIFLKNSDEAYRNKIFNFYIYNNPKIFKEFENEIIKDSIWQDVFYKNNNFNFNKTIIANDELISINTLRQLKSYLFKKQIESIDKNYNIDYQYIYIQKKELIFSELFNIDFELYHKFLTSLDTQNKILLIEKSLDVTFKDNNILSLISSQFFLEENESIFSNNLINNFYEKYESYCLKKEIKEKKPGEGIYNEIDTLVEFYFKLENKLFDSYSKRQKLKATYLNYYSYYLGLFITETNIDLDAIDYNNFFRSLVYNKHNLKRVILDKIENVEEKLINFLKKNCTDIYKTKYYLNFLLDKKIEFKRLYMQNNINVLKELAIEKKNTYLMDKILNENGNLEYDRELFEFLFKYEDKNLKKIIINLYNSSNLKVILFKMDLEELVKKINLYELKILFLLWIILKVKNILLSITALEILKKDNYEDVIIPKNMMKILKLSEYLDKNRKVEIDILKNKIERF